jgi:hypothetical protein
MPIIGSFSGPPHELALRACATPARTRAESRSNDHHGCVLGESEANPLEQLLSFASN